MASRTRAPRLALVVALAAGLVSWSVSDRISATNSPTGLDVTGVHARVADGTIRVSATLVSDRDRAVRGWFILASPGEPAPWERFDHYSAEQTLSLQAGSPVVVEWSEPLSVPAGTYQPSLWFHEPRGDEWAHATGGAFSMPPITVPGPQSRLHQFFGGAVAAIDLEHLQVEPPRLSAALRIDAASGLERLVLAWELRPAGEGEAGPVYRGREQILDVAGAGSASLTVEDELAIPPGSYDLWLRVSSADGSGRPQLAVIPGAVTTAEAPPLLRQQAPAGAYRWQPATAGRQPRLRPGSATELSLAATRARPQIASSGCAAYWDLLAPGAGTVADGNAGRCERPAVLLPDDLTPGRYDLHLKAYEVDGSTGASLLSDAVSVEVEVAR